MQFVMQSLQTTLLIPELENEMIKLHLKKQDLLCSMTSLHNSKMYDMFMIFECMFGVGRVTLKMYFNTWMNVYV